MNVSRAKSALAWRLNRLAKAGRDLTPRLAAALPDRRRPRLIVLDDVFPNPLSAFRVTEFEAYLNHFPGAEVHTDPASGGAFAQAYHRHLDKYLRANPQHAGRVRSFNPHKRLNASLFYCIFLNNAYRFVETIDKHGAGFAFTLYPGGGFQLDDPESDRKLARVFSSANLRKVIVTQPLTRDYLLRKRFCADDKIVSIYGVVAPAAPAPLPKRRFGVDKPTLDLCFIAHKYTPAGIDKGYDTFVEVATRLSRRRPELRFHVVGGFSADDIDVSALQDRIRFYGPQGRAFFPEFFRDMDLILSPNLPFKLCPGAFDGFPTGCCVDAALANVAVFCTDELKQNGPFKAGEEIVVIPPRADEICQSLETYLGDYPRLLALAERGRQAFLNVYAAGAQIAPRIRVLEEVIARPAAIGSPSPRASAIPAKCGESEFA